jgi:flagellin-like hook-associated protein FlgL
MATSNLYQDLKNALNDFKTFLDTNTDKIKQAIGPLKQLIPQIGDLISKLVDLMNKLKTEIQNLNVTNIPGLSQFSAFATAAQTLLTTAESLLPDQKTAIDDVLSVVNVAAGLPSLDSVKQDIVNLIDGIITDLNKLATA